MTECKEAQKIYDWKMLFCGLESCDLGHFYKEYEQKDLNFKRFFGVNIFPKYIALNNEIPVKLSIWDVDLLDKQSGSRKTYMEGSMGAIIITNSSKSDFLYAIKEILVEMKVFAGNIPFIVIDRNKMTDSELKSEVNQKVLKLWVEWKGGIFVMGKYLNKRMLNRTLNRLSEIVFRKLNPFFDLIHPGN